MKKAAIEAISTYLPEDFWQALNDVLECLYDREQELYDAGELDELDDGVSEIWPAVSNLMGWQAAMRIMMGKDKLPTDPQSAVEMRGLIRRLRGLTVIA